MYLITADLHLTSRPRDAYRFGIFKWLASQQVKLKPKATFILGDVTDRKDRHPAELVDRIVGGLIDLRPPVYWLLGNHDYHDPECPFFGFLNYIDGLIFVTEPEMITPDDNDDCVFMMPHRRSQQAFDEACAKIPKQAAVMLHQTIDGAEAEHGVHLSGINTNALAVRNPKWVYAGDVHTPQRVGIVTYVGAPYTVRFGDHFEPRVAYVNRDGKCTNLYFDCPRKWTLRIDSPEDIESNDSLRKGDQVKIEIVLAREELREWQARKRKILDACAQLGLEVFGVTLSTPTVTDTAQVRQLQAMTPEDQVKGLCQREKVNEAVKQVGLELLNVRHNSG